MTPESPPAPAQPPAKPRWPAERIILWSFLAVVAVLHRGPAFLRAMKPPEGRFYDFFQEWASARNYLDGLPVYTPLEVAAARLTGQSISMQIAYNAHPPASILLALPFAQMPYREAHFVWNLLMLLFYVASLFMIIRGLNLPFTWWSLLPTLTLTLYCFPLDHQIAQGQLNLVLLFLMTLGWYCDRLNRPCAAGAAIGLAAGFKLFPAFLFLYFLMRGNWRAIVVGGISFAFVNGLALALFGTVGFSDYVRVVLPSVDHYRSSWPNLSLTGFWLRLFDPIDGENAIPLVHSPIAAKACLYASTAAIVCLVALRCRRSDTREDPDFSFAVCIVAMLLVSPITWNHYFLFLCLPLAILWRDLVDWRRWIFRVLLVLMWLPPGIYHLIGMGKNAASKWENARRELPALTPPQNLLVASLLTYVLAALFALVLLTRQPAHTKPLQQMAP